MNESTDSISLTDFLRARIAEDEERARAAMQRGLLPGDGPARWRDEDRDGNPGHSVVWNGVGQAVVSHAYHHQGAHIARHDPTRVLADCEAKRLIVSHMQIVAGIIGPRGEDARAVLTWLALPYADHPDFREEWKS